jgi:PAS domain S-box-containing protein
MAVLALALVLRRSMRLREVSRQLAERQRLQGVLEESARKLREVLETALDAVLAIAPDGRLLEWNAQAEVLFGWSKHEVLERRADQLLVPRGQSSELTHFLATRDPALIGQRLVSVAWRRTGDAFRVLSLVRHLAPADRLVRSAGALVLPLDWVRTRCASLLEPRRFANVGDMSPTAALPLPGPSPRGFSL